MLCYTEGAVVQYRPTTVLHSIEAVSVRQTSLLCLWLGSAGGTTTSKQIHQQKERRSDLGWYGEAFPRQALPQIVKNGS